MCPAPPLVLSADCFVGLADANVCVVARLLCKGNDNERLQRFALVGLLLSVGVSTCGVEGQRFRFKRIGRGVV